MNKILLYIMSLAALMVVGCDTYDDRYEEEYASVVRLESYGENTLQVPASEAETVYELNVMRSGHDISSAVNATVRVMSDDEWTSYANTYGMQRYYRAPAECYSFEGGGNGVILHFNSNQYFAGSELTVYSEKLQKYAASLPPPEQEGEEWANVICVPITLEVDKGSVFSERKYLILRLVYDAAN